MMMSMAGPPPMAMGGPMMGGNPMMSGMGGNPMMTGGNPMMSGRPMGSMMGGGPMGSMMGGGPMGSQMMLNNPAFASMSGMRMTENGAVLGMAEHGVGGSHMVTARGKMLHPRHVEQHVNAQVTGVNLGGAPAAHVLPDYLLPENYNAVAQQVADRLDDACVRREELLDDLSLFTNTDRERLPLEGDFSLLRKAHLDKMDWRVAKLMYCKDPKYNMGMDPSMAYEVQQKKAREGAELERQLGQEATAWWTESMQGTGQRPPLEETVVRDGLPFVEVAPTYQAGADLWSRRLDLRTLEEAMNGDLSRPLPRPVLFPEDYDNFKEGKYVKDDCLIA
eukprot:TRINITY_DN30122_c0_g2_i1.p1 TRINITY_DN30122_c0_g2~~TRINITY_DN30122_c0_g2_i1.p1  ORF type:complete len:334 (-),score=75.25 TRINITY_DN30122_c0_g2_i1:159-1160(-)